MLWWLPLELLLLPCLILLPLLRPLLLVYVDIATIGMVATGEFSANTQLLGGLDPNTQCTYWYLSCSGPGASYGRQGTPVVMTTLLLTPLTLLHLLLLGRLLF